MWETVRCTLYFVFCILDFGNQHLHKTYANEETWRGHKPRSRRIEQANGVSKSLDCRHFGV